MSADPPTPAGSGSRRRLLAGLGVVGVALLVIVLIVAVASSGGAHRRHAAPTTASTTPPVDPAASAVALYDAWKAGDQVAAARVASPQALSALFAVPYRAQPSPAGPVDPNSFQGCQGAAGSTFCAWRAAGVGTITVRIQNSATPPLAVDVQRTSP